MKRNIIVLASGNGTNLQAIIDNLHKKGQATIVHVISNKKDSFALTRAQKAQIRISLISWWDKKNESREAYDNKLALYIKEIILQSSGPYLIVLAGWMHLLGEAFLRYFPENNIINLHPALPRTYKGANAIEMAFDDKQNTKGSGIMVHTVIKEMDSGNVIKTCKVKKEANDTFELFKLRMQAAEKPLLLEAINLQFDILEAIDQVKESRCQSLKLVFQGKVRNMYQFYHTDKLLCIETSDRCSCFDRHICDIPGKGQILSKMTVWWFQKTRQIIPNHLLFDYHSYLIVKKCKVFPIEFVVRGYITGTTNTAMWKLYSENGIRTFDHLTLEDNMKKNQRLPRPIVTPTTKSTDHDEPITRDQIISRGIMSATDFDYCYQKAIELFIFGQEIASQHNLLLVDTKYEFGIDNHFSNLIVLVDEMHTCDSSRYWRKDTYDTRFAQSQEPDRYDKDILRLFLKEHCNPYDIKSSLPPIPENIIQNLAAMYAEVAKVTESH